MFDFTKVHSSPINKEFIFKQLTESQIFYYYFGPFDFYKQYLSVFRAERRPSTSFYTNRYGHIIYHDFTTGDNFDCISFVAKTYNLTYGEAIRRIATDFGLIDPALRKVTPEMVANATSLDNYVKKETIIEARPCKWREEHITYWKLYEATPKELEREGIFPIDYLKVNGKEVVNKYRYMRFALHEKVEGKHYFKIYSPQDKYMKWISNFPLALPFGYHSLNRNSDTCIITKSKKDLVILKRLFPSVMATQNENVSALPEDIRNDLLSTFRRCIVFWDNDETGVNNCKKLNDMGFDYFNIPKGYLEKFGIKDASDYVAYYGTEALKELFKEKGIL